MKKIKLCHIKLALSALLFSVTTFTANAQKLPNVQQTSLLAPVNVKIDGKANEWGETLQAYNKATEIYYTLANDDENIYLTIQVKNEDIINKIIDGGVSLIIQKSGGKKSRDNISVTYPAYDTPNNKSKLRFNLSNSGIPNADSLMLINNAKLDKNCKLIKVTGIAGTDSLISIYNSEGIKAASLFNTSKVYTIEMSIALKYLDISTIGATKFAYHLLLNGATPLDWRNIHPRAPADGSVGTLEYMQDAIKKAVDLDAPISTPTDFWGEYTLAKK